MRLVEQKERGWRAGLCRRKAGHKLYHKRDRCRFWRHWMKNRDNDEDVPMYNRFMGWEL